MLINKNLILSILLFTPLIALSEDKGTIIDFDTSSYIEEEMDLFNVSATISRHDVLNKSLEVRADLDKEKERINKAIKKLEKLDKDLKVLYSNVKQEVKEGSPTSYRKGEQLFVASMNIRLKFKNKELLSEINRLFIMEKYSLTLSFSKEKREQVQKKITKTLIEQINTESKNLAVYMGKKDYKILSINIYKNHRNPVMFNTFKTNESISSLKSINSKDETTMLIPKDNIELSARVSVEIK